MTEGLFYDEADDPMCTGYGATDAAEHGQQTGLSEAAALRRLADMGCDPLAAANATGQARLAVDGIVYLNGIRIRYDEGYGYSAERAPQPVQPDVAVSGIAEDAAILDKAAEILERRFHESITQDQVTAGTAHAWVRYAARVLHLEAEGYSS